MSHWLSELLARTREGEVCALVTVVNTRGSVPREAGTRMLVTSANTSGTIGGGQLEFQAVEQARRLLRAGPSEQSRSAHSYTLGPELEQCCGGVVDLVIECFQASQPGWPRALDTQFAQTPCVLIGQLPQTAKPVGGRRLLISANAQWGSLGDARVDTILKRRARAMLNAEKNRHGMGREVQTWTEDGHQYLLEIVSEPRMQVVLFGAGHVGKALVKVLAEYPCQVTWIDSRADEFPDSVPPNVTITAADDPATLVIDAPPNAYYLVMTHSHPLDFAICKAVLARDFLYLGLIGSKSKRARFNKNLRLQGADPEQLARLTCPVGIDSITSKHPGAIAIAVAAQLIELDEQHQSAIAEVDSEEPAHADG